MWGLLVFLGFVTLLIPAVWYWAWRGKFSHKPLAGARLEEHRRQMKIGVKRGLPGWGMVLLATANQSVDLFCDSRDFRFFWLGFFIASALFLMGFNLNNLATLLRQEREKRQPPEPKGRDTTAEA